METFGSHLKHLRKERGLTLRDLSESSGLAQSTLSKTENSKISPTYDNLLKLVKGLDIDLSTLLNIDSSGIEDPVKGQLTRYAITYARMRGRHPATTYIYEPLGNQLTRKLMDPTFVTVTARHINEFDNLISHAGEELIYVLSGAIEVYTEHYAPEKLGSGDSLYFDAHMGHAYISISEEDATILNIVAGASNSFDKMMVKNAEVTNSK